MDHHHMAGHSHDAHNHEAMPVDHSGHETTHMPGHDSTTQMPGHDHSTMSHMMSMAFHGGCSETILFDGWKIDSTGGLIGSMIGIFVMAALYEGLKYYREYLFWKTYGDMQYRAVTISSEKTPDEKPMSRPTMMSWPHVFQTGMHIVQIVLSYFLMLIFMTYNVWLCIAVVAGAAVGYFLFGWKKTVIVDVTEHCH